MRSVPEVSTEWIIELVNVYARRPREVAGEKHLPYPQLKVPGPAVAGRISRYDLIALADDIWAVFVANEARQRAAALNQMLDDADVRPHTDASGQPRYATGQRNRLPILAAGCAVAILETVRRDGWSHLGICAAHDCVDAYIDRRGRTPRKFCSATCLNRTRVRAHRARHT